jgi:hypothetical protein
MRMENMKILYMAVRTVLRAEQTRLLVGPGSLITRTPASQIGTTVLTFKLKNQRTEPVTLRVLEKVKYRYGTLL